LFVSWGLYFVLVLLFFKEPDRSAAAFSTRGMSSHRNLDALADADADSASLRVPFLQAGGGYSDNGNSSIVQEYSVSEDEEASERASESRSTTEDSDYGDDKAVETVRELVKELSRPVKILLWIYFMLKFASELLISESSILTDHYFGWRTSQVAVFLSLLGLTVLPSSAVVGNWISNLYEDRAVVLWSQVATGVGVVAIVSFEPYAQYSAHQYVAAAVVVFVATNVLEGVTMSLLSKVMSPRLSRGVFNCGLLSTEAGTLARALADGLISVAGRSGGVAHLLNLTMLPTLALVAATTAYTCLGYHTLY
jgi:hypothetical protein